MSSRRWPSTLRISWPFRDHDNLDWYKNPLRVFIPSLVGCTGKIRDLQYFWSRYCFIWISFLNPRELLRKAFPELKNFQ